MMTILTCADLCWDQHPTTKNEKKKNVLRWPEGPHAAGIFDLQPGQSQA